MTRKQSLELYKALNRIELDLTKYKMLEIGCGNEYFLRSLVNLGF
jgi:hypothetical protein